SSRDQIVTELTWLNENGFVTTTVKGDFVVADPEALWEPRDAPARYNAEYALADPAQWRVAELTLSTAPYPNQVQRVMRAYVEEEQRVVRHVLTLPTDALVLETLDVVAWSSARHEYDNKAFEVSSHIDPLISGTQRVTLKEREPDDAEWSSSFEITTTIGSSFVTPLEPQEVTDFAVAPSSIEDENGIPARPAILLTWDGDQEDVRGLEYEIRAADGTSIVTGSVLNVAEGSFTVVEGVLPNKDYLVRARFVVYRPTIWTDLLPVKTLDLKIRPDDIDAPAFAVSGLLIFDGKLQSSNFVAGELGWQITEDGQAEFNDLIARSSLQVGAVSDVYELLAPDEVHVPDNSYAQIMTFGALEDALVQHFYVSFQYRRAGSRTRTTSNSDGPVTSTRNVETDPIVRIRYFKNGVWSGYGTLLNPSSYGSGAWRGTGTLTHITGPYDAAQIQLLVEHDIDVTDTLTNIRHVWMRVQGVVR
ncbi:MAG: hypothetical protein ABJL72_04295, partial [Roseobacter sp.]